MPDAFGKRLRTLIKQQGLTQQELADALDISRNTVWRWINNKATPESYMLQKLATMLHVSVDDLLNYSSPDSSSGEWTIRINVADKFTMEVIDLKGNIQPVAQITATPDGLAFTIKAPWDMLGNKAGLEKLFKRILKESYPAMRGTGVALGGIKD